MDPFLAGTLTFFLLSPLVLVHLKFVPLRLKKTVEGSWEKKIGRTEKRNKTEREDHEVGGGQKGQQRRT